MSTQSWSTMELIFFASIHPRMGLNVAIKGCAWCTASKWFLQARGLMCAKNTFSTPLHHQDQPVMLTTEGRMDPWILAVYTKFDSTICVSQQTSRFTRRGNIFQFTTLPISLVDHVLAESSVIDFHCCRPIISRCNMLYIERWPANEL